MGETSPPPAAAAGWYPDPSGPPGQQRYWDGRQWTAVQPPPPPPKSAAGTPKGGKFVLGVIAAIAVFAAIAAIVEKTGDSEETAPTSTSLATARPTVSTTAAAAPTPQPVEYLPCQPAPATVVEIVNASFADGTSQLRNAQAVELPQAMTYIGADIYQGDERVSSQDRWLVSGGAVFAISPDARRRTLLPDGRDLLPMDDYDERQSLDACVLQAARG